MSAAEAVEATPRVRARERRRRWEAGEASVWGPPVEVTPKKKSERKKREYFLYRRYLISHGDYDNDEVLSETRR